MPIQTKTCPSCQANNILIKAKHCHRCGYEWPGLSAPTPQSQQPKNHIANQILLVIVLLVIGAWVLDQIALVLRDPFPETTEALRDIDRQLNQLERRSP